MLRVFHKGARTLRAETPAADWSLDPDVIWIDLFEPTREEELAVERALDVELPTAAEMAEIEPSSRLYQENGATFMTATLLARSQDETPASTPVTFVLANGRLITLRYAELKAFSVFAERAPQSDAGSGTMALFGLLDAVVQRLADVLEAMEERVNEASAGIFHRPKAGDFRPLLTNLAGAQSVTGLNRKSLVSLARMLSYAALAHEISDDLACRAHLISLQADVQALTEHAGYLSSHISFLLDAALGLINIEQNGIIKFFSVVAVVFLPPTLVASIYGMNFRHMPELNWWFGYPMAIVLMIGSAILPILWFKRRGWL
jgi:magnesium transporter